MKPNESGALEMNYASGPYKLQSYSPARQIVMVFNKNYDQALGVRGHVAKFVFNIGDEASQAALEIQAGQLDFQTSNLATADIIRISQNAALPSQVHTSTAAVAHLHLPEQPGGAAEQRGRPQGDQLRGRPDGDRRAVGRPAGRAR